MRRKTLCLLLVALMCFMSVGVSVADDEAKEETQTRSVLTLLCGLQSLGGSSYEMYGNVSSNVQDDLFASVVIYIWQNETWRYITGNSNRAYSSFSVTVTKPLSLASGVYKIVLYGSGSSISKSKTVTVQV